MTEDPICPARWFWDLGDSRSALSSPKLMRDVYFSQEYPQWEEFYKTLNRSESMLWPCSMMYRFVDVDKVKTNAGGRVYIMAGEKDEKQD